MSETQLGEGAAALMRVPFTALEHLELKDCAFDVPRWCGAFGRATHLSTLRTLWLQRAGPGVVEGVCEATYLQLDTLNLSDNQLEPYHISRLGRRPHLASLKRLALSKNPGAAMVEGLARVDFPALEALELEECGLQPDHLKRLLEVPFSARLRELSLYVNALPTLDALAEATHITALRTLRASFNGLSQAGFEAIARAEHLGTLEQLDLRGFQ